MISMTIVRAGGYDNALYLLKTEAASSQTSTDAAKEKEKTEQAGVSTAKAGFSSYVFAQLDGVTVLGGDGADYISTFSFAAIAGGGGDDDINVYDFSIVSGGAGNDHISAYRFAGVTGGAGNDTIETYAFAAVDGGDGDDNIFTYDHSFVSGGNGNDRIRTGDYSIIAGGAGDDWLHTYSHSTVGGGEGNDTILGYDHVTADGGAGNDIIFTYDYANLAGGKGNDLMAAYGNSLLDGGDGNDVLLSEDHSTNQSTFGNSVLNGGAGNDYLQAGNGAKLTGGTGNDVIRVMGDNATVYFGRGDGSDTIRSNHDLTIDVSGYSKEDISVRSEDDRLIVSFAGSTDTLTLDLTANITATLQFSNGSTLDVTQSDTRKTLSHVIMDVKYNGDIGEADVVYFEKARQVRGPESFEYVGGRSATVESLTQP